LSKVQITPYCVIEETGAARTDPQKLVAASRHETISAGFIGALLQYRQISGIRGALRG
jgi:hypothetical protein